MVFSAIAGSIVLGQAAGVYPVATERGGVVFVHPDATSAPISLGPGKKPIVGPYGRKVAYVATDRDGKQSIRVVNIREPRDPRTAANVPNGEYFQPAWSDDGTQITFEHRFPEEGRTLYVWKVREDRAVGILNVTDESEKEFSPSFAGNNVAFVLNDQLFVRNSSTGSLDRNPFEAMLNGLPQDSKVTFVSAVRANPGSYVYTVTTTSGVAALFRHNFRTNDTVRLSPVGIRATRPMLSPDPRQILFWGTDEEGETWLYSVATNGQRLSKVLKKEAPLS